MAKRRQNKEVMSLSSKKKKYYEIDTKENINPN